MHLSTLQVFWLVFASAVAAVLTIFSWAFTTGKSPSDDGPRALISEFTGYWVGFFFLFCSFTIKKGNVQWKLWGMAALGFIVALGLSAYFANKTEVTESPEKEPTGFKNNTTDFILSKLSHHSLFLIPLFHRPLVPYH